MKEIYRVSADAMVVLHLFYVFFAVGGLVFILLGSALRWRGTRNRVFRTTHLIAVALVGVEAATGLDCPLTVGEYNLRRLAGQVVEQDISFIARLARVVIFYDFPRWVFTVLHVSFGLLVMLVYFLIPARKGSDEARRQDDFNG